MTMSIHSAERAKFDRFRAELVFPRHQLEPPRARVAAQATIDEGSEPLLIDALERRRMHLRHALLDRKLVTGP